MARLTCLSVDHDSTFTPGFLSFLRNFHLHPDYKYDLCLNYGDKLEIESRWRSCNSTSTKGQRRKSSWRIDIAPPLIYIDSIDSLSFTDRWLRTLQTFYSFATWEFQYVCYFRFTLVILFTNDWFYELIDTLCSFLSRFVPCTLLSLAHAGQIRSRLFKYTRPLSTRAEWRLSHSLFICTL